MQHVPGRQTEHNPNLGRIGYRPYWMRHLALFARATHQLGAAVVVAAYLLDALPGPPRAYLLLALISGFVLLAAEGMQHRQLLRETVGVITLLKMLLFGAAYHGFLPALETTLLVFILAALIAHAPKKVRHRLLY
jgi:hypothetical protein